MLILDFLKDVWGFVLNFLISIVAGIYEIAALGFRVFLMLANGELLDSSAYELIIKNMYAVIGVVMLFVIAFALLKMMVNSEDQKSATTVKKMIINLITSVMIIAILPTAFGFAFDFQRSVLNHGTLGLFFGFGQYSENVNDNDAVKQVKNGANMIVNSVFLAFFDITEEFGKWVSKQAANPNMDGYKEPHHFICNENFNKSVTVEGETYGPQQIIEACRKASKENYNDYWFTDNDEHTGRSLYEQINRVNNGASFFEYARFSHRVANNDIKFNFLMALIGGALLAYVSVIYCFDMGKRLVKLVFFQLIAPIPIMLRVVPEGKLSSSFNEWWKITLACYVEVFIRVFVLYAVIFMCVKINNSDFVNETLVEFGWLEAVLGKVFIFAGLIMFMKEAPKLISQITGIDSGNMSFSLKDKLADSGLLTAGAAIGAGATAFTRNGVNAIKNSANKFKDIKGKTGKDKVKAAFGAVGSIFKGAGSVAAGTASAQIRAGKAGWNAKSLGDMKNAASRGAKGAVDARNKRASYKAAHGGKFGSAMVGHAQDAIYGVGRWAGLNNIDSLVAENQLIGEIQSQRKAIDSEAFDIIDGDLAKGKIDSVYSAFVYDKDTGRYKENAFAKELGIKHSMFELRALESKLAAAKNSGDAREIQKAQLEYSQYRNDWADELRNISLLGQSSWNELESTKDGKELMADLSKLRIASDTYRETLKSNSNASYISELDGVSDILDKNKNLNMKHAGLKDIKNAMKIAQTKNTNKINAVRRKDSETKKK